MSGSPPDAKSGEKSRDNAGHKPAHRSAKPSSSDPGEYSRDIKIRHCHSLAEFEEGVRIERLIWGEEITVPAPIFVVADHTGGQVLGAFDGNKMVGVTLALAGFRGRLQFLHSHMTGVLPEYQNLGVGRRLKLFQRQEALRSGIHLVEWTFDPLELKNARFNLGLLGAVARRYIPDCYGVTTSPLHAGLPTDRLVAEWWLDSTRVKEILAGNQPPANPAVKRISVPASISDLKSKNRAEGARVQTETREKFLGLFGKEYVATGIENRGANTDYLLEPRDSVAGVHLPEWEQD
jgi:predicted GNAT superfamily acetyltransferase